ncbi:Programmed cell death antitoxin YdcD [Bacillus cereus]|nr:Programmed cell death antitoxin YdcD [Bacillus cereus]
MSESSVTTEIVVRLPKQMVTELDGIGKQENKNRHELICQATQLLLRQHKTKKRYQHESMRRGYIEMGKINLGIASEAFLAEYEAAHTVERLVSGGNILIVKRGDVYFADLSPVVGSEQGGVRPVLVIQNDIGNRFSPTVIVAAITAQIQKAKLPTHVEIDAKKYGFERDSVILLEQIRTIDKQRLTDKITHLDEVMMSRVDEALQISLGLIDF